MQVFLFVRMCMCVYAHTNTVTLTHYRHPFESCCALRSINQNNTHRDTQAKKWRLEQSTVNHIRQEFKSCGSPDYT